jgi:hypothetical protein
LDKESLLLKLSSDLEALTGLLTDIPPEALETPQAVGNHSVKQTCALFAAWDGECIRRIDFVTGQRVQPPHDPNDTTYWQAWEQTQIGIKDIMPVRGVIVDMVSVRQRLISKVTDLNDFYFERWLEEDPQASQAHYTEALPQIQAWRSHWDELHPPAKGLRKWWQIIKQKWTALVGDRG